MKKYLLILLFLIIGCEQLLLLNPIDVVNLTTDKELYHSGEIINITADIGSPFPLNNVSVRFYGIYSRGYRLDQTKIVDLKKGQNTVNLNYIAPRCYGCSGISPGTYKVNINISYNKISTNISKSIEIRQ